MAEDKNPKSDSTGTEAPFREMGTPPADPPVDPKQQPPAKGGAGVQPEKKGGI
ncbi:hypothetical protein [Roseomonas sp. 18066]|uniref:hypothetical protein n=1 Tax=Roseomonas sp. 18066 TaxID=2681412 RepID=UPI001357EA8E|nr:hypothetical protein [Roseomonas sp. 18066]